MLHKLNKLFVVGDFDGDGVQDTVFQHNYSRFKKTEIVWSPEPSQNEWDVVIKWFYDHDADVYLSLNGKDTLHLGAAQGLYCLINTGDNNADGKDEIAFVIDYLDFSRINSCKIYSFCNGQWALLKQFEVYEDAFDLISDAMPTFDCITDHLEKRNGINILLCKNRLR